MTTLTFTRKGGASWSGTDEHGTELFSIHPSTSRTEQYVTVRSQLPGLHSDKTFNATDGRDKYDASLRDEAIEYCRALLSLWIRQHLGLTVAVNSVTNDS